MSDGWSKDISIQQRFHNSVFPKQWNALVVLLFPIPTIICVGDVSLIFSTLRWSQNGRDIISGHQPHDCLLNRLFRHRSKKTSKLRVTGLRVGNSQGTGEFPAQMASNAENVSIRWRHHEWASCHWNYYVKARLLKVLLDVYCCNYDFTTVKGVKLNTY